MLLYYVKAHRFFFSGSESRRKSRLPPWRSSYVAAVYATALREVTGHVYSLFMRQLLSNDENNL